MKKVITMLLGLVLLGSPVIAQRIPVEGWYKMISAEQSKGWRDSGKRTHFHSIKRFGEVSIFGEGFGFKGKSESEFGLTILDESNFFCMGISWTILVVKDCYSYSR